MDEPNLELSVDQSADDSMSGDQPSANDQSGKIIKPCKVQVIDILKQNAFPGMIQGKSNDSDKPLSDTPSSSSKGVEMVTDDGWIVEDDEGKVQSGSDQEDDYMDAESDAEYDGDSDDWFEDPDNSSDNTTQSPQKSKNEQSSEIEDEKSDAFYLNQELDDDILKETMKVVYGVKDPKSDTLTLLKEQMEERPKLKIKLLKDLKLGNSMFQKGGRKTMYRSRRDRRRVQKQVIVERQLNVSGDGGQSPQGAQPQTLVGNTASAGLPGSSNSDWEPHRPLTLANATAHLAGRYTKPPPLNQNISFRRILPKNLPGYPTKIKGPSNSSSNPTAQQPASDTTQGDKPKQPPQNIKFLDETLPENRAVFLPKSRTIKVPKLNPGPPGSVDVLVPVDASGQMKPPFVAIPMNSCNLEFTADGKEPISNQLDDLPSGSSQENTGSHSAEVNVRDPSTGGNTPVSGNTVQASVGTDGSLQASSTQTQQAMQQIPQGAVMIPVSGAFPNVIPLNTPGMVPQPMLRPQVQLPPGVHPNGHYGLVPAGVFPPGIPGVFPPGVIPANIIPPLGPAGVPPGQPSMGPPREQYPCTCPPGSQKPPPPYPQAVTRPPQAPQVHIKVEQTEETNHTNHAAAPDNSPKDDQSEQGIKISNVRSAAHDGHSCATNPAKRPGHLAQPKEGGVPNAASPAPGKGHPGSLVTVILPETARQYYTSPPKNLSEEVKKPVTGLDLGLVWNEIKMMKSEMQYMKTVVAADMHGLRAEMTEFMKEVREKLSGLNRGQVTGRESEERNGVTKRKAPDSPHRNTRAKSSL